MKCTYSFFCMQSAAFLCPTHAPSHHRAIIIQPVPRIDDEMGHDADQLKFIQALPFYRITVMRDERLSHDLAEIATTVQRGKQNVSLPHDQTTINYRYTL